MRRIWNTAVYLALIILVLTLMALAGQPVETPEPTPSETQTPAPSSTALPTPEHTGPTTIVIDGLELDGIDDLWVGIPVEGMPE